MQKDYSSQNLECAGFCVRLCAYVLDHIIVFFGVLAVRLVLMAASFVLGLIGVHVLDVHVLFQYSLKDIALYLCQVLYFIVCTYETGTTPGKRVFHLRVVSAKKNEKLRLFDIVYRETIGRFLCHVSIGLGYLLVVIDRRKMGLHDRLSDTQVVYAKKIKEIHIQNENTGFLL